MLDPRVVLVKLTRKYIVRSSCIFLGGTDIIACFAAQNWTVPVYRGEIQSCNLGCDMQSWSEEGET